MKIRLRILRVIIGCAILLMIIGWGWRKYNALESPELASQHGVRVLEPDVAVIVIRTSYPSIPIHTDPDQRITAGPVIGNFAWEKSVNGVPVKRFPVNGPPIDLVNPATIGTTRTIAYRILEGQGVDSAEFVYYKHRSVEPPSGWFEAALSTRH